MADKKEKYTENVPGKFYVDKNCIACDACVLEAGKNFTIEDDHSKVTKQPETPEEEEACMAALGACPTNAIGDDGDQE